MTIDYRIRENDKIVSEGVFSVPDDATYDEIENKCVEAAEASLIVEWKYPDEEDSDENWR